MSKILVVDDDEMLIMMAKFILSTRYEVVTANSGTEAIDIFLKEKPDLVLTDLMMPEMNGYQLQQELQSHCDKPVPIVFMTADESQESESRGFEMGAADYIRKPFNPPVLMRRVGNILENLDKIHGLEVIASIDPLTKLMNKSTVQKEIDKCIKMTSGVLIILDLDNFKAVNDIYGHGTGDKFLTQFAEFIRKIIRSEDLAGRIGGDEFIVFFNGMYNESILRSKIKFLNEQILIAARKLMDPNINIPLGVSAGAVFVPDEGTDFADLYKKSDQALYNAKEEGKHSLSIFGTHQHAQNNLPNENISQMTLILGERNDIPGAYFIEFEIFKKTYQLLSRMIEAYGMDLMLVQFTVEDRDYEEELKKVLLKSLRRSDCVSKVGNKFLLLLPKMTAKDIGNFKKRIFARIDSSQIDKIGFEYESV
ncbi:MAG: diguanylate cyclase [Selenomonadaceae bacterium]|nr:diguanylate cyclase [Selenomonadaceae bacterium]